MWVEALRLRDVRNIRELEVELSPGLNVFVGENAQGKTSLLEAVGLIARGRSFRSGDSRAMIRRGTPGLSAMARARDAAGQAELGVELDAAGRRFQLNGRTVPPREYRGRLEVVVYSSARLRLVQGAMRERRSHLDRGAAALWPSYHETLRRFERTLLQRNAALARRASDLETWDERFSALAGELRVRRSDYARRLTRALEGGFRPCGERYAVGTEPDAAGQDATVETARIVAELRARRRDELHAGRSLVGPQRDAVTLSVDGRDAAEVSSGQARSLLLALTLAALDVYQDVHGAPAIALLDDLDSELDDARGRAVCTRFSEQGQALVTTAHPAFSGALADGARVFAVAAGEVRPAYDGALGRA
jgi:DNA replication and repair protein RecF